MPARLDIDRDQVKMLALSVGAREAARRLGMKETTVKQWATRGKWFAQPPKPALPPTVLQPVAIVAKPAEILADVLADDSQQTRVAFSQAARKAAQELASREGKDLVSVGKSAKSWVDVADATHGWRHESAPAGMVNIQVINATFPLENGA